MEQDRICKDFLIYPGAVDPNVVGPDPGTQHRFESPERGQTEVGQTLVTVTQQSETP